MTAKEYLDKGNEFYENQDFKRAIESYTEAIRLDPEYTAAYNNRGSAKTALQRYQESIEDFDIAIRLDPEYANAYNNRGIAKKNLGRYQESIEDFDTAIRLDPEFATAYYNRGIAKDNLGRYQEAIEDYDTAIRLDPEYANAYNNRGSAKTALQRYQESIEDFDIAIRLDPEYANAYNNRGNAKDNLGRYQESIEDYDTAIRLDPEFATAYYNRGIAKDNLGRYQESIEDFDTAIRLDPEFATAYYNRGNAKTALQRYQESIEDFDTAIRLDPEDANAYNNRGNAKDNLGRYQESIEDFDTAIRLDPEFATAYYNRGNVKDNLGRYQESIEDFDTAIRLDPEFALPWHGKGLIYYLDRNPAWAKICFTRSVYLGLHNLSNAFIFFGDHPTAPFLTMRLIQEHIPPAQYGKLANLINMTFSQISPLYSFITHESLERSKKYTEANWNKWLGIINYYMGDPITSFQVLSDLVRKGSQDLMVFYYLILSCDDFAEDPDPYIAKAIEIAERVKEQKHNTRLFFSTKLPEEQLLEHYYAGQVFLLDEEPEDALECFSKIQKYFLPAAYMSLLVWNDKKEQTKRDRLKKEIIKREKKAEKKGFARGLDTHYVDLQNDKIHQPFAHYFRYFELTSAIKIFADIAQNETPFQIKRPSSQKPFYELFKIQQAGLNDIRRRLALAPLLKEWEDALQIQKETAIKGGKEPRLVAKGRTIKATFKEFQAAYMEGELETDLGEHIEEFSLKPAQYEEFLNYFYLKGQLTEYQKLLLHFYILDQAIKKSLPPKYQLAGIKDGVKKAVSEGLTAMTGIVIGGTVSGLSVPAALAVGIGIAFAKGSLGELFMEFYKTAGETLPFTYRQFRSEFESYIAKEKERLGAKFEKRYPIVELHKTFLNEK